jgi:pyridoxine 5-phosphate synthase
MRLHINVDHVATLRNARGTSYPDPIEAARLCLDAGASGITAHLREDRRHICDDDIHKLRILMQNTTFNLEMAATDEMVDIACHVRPNVVTLVPERRQERTTEGGLEVARASVVLKAHVDTLRAHNIKVSLFIAADAAQVEASHVLGVEQIELHTGDYAHAFDGAGANGAKKELARIASVAKLGRALGLDIAAGHGLTTQNVSALVMAAPEIVELNIGHAVISDAVFFGLEGAVHAMLAAIAEGGAGRR